MTKDNKISIYIVEDYLLIRKSLIQILKQDSRFEVIGDFANAEDFITQFKLQPSDVVIMDLGLPNMNGLQATKLTKEISPDTKVIILTSHENTDEIIAALAVGANAYCLKEIESYFVHSLVLDVYNGALWLRPQVQDIAQEFLSKGSAFNLDMISSGTQLTNCLTDDEKIILNYIIEGKTNSEIAQILNIDEHLSKTYISSILSKLSTDNNVQSIIDAKKIKVLD